MQKLLVILGPTSSGKTDLAIKLAKKFNGELIACDSRQVYKKLDIGTGKLPSGKMTVEKGKGFWLMGEVKIWLYDVADFKKQYTVYDYVKDANKVIDDIAKRQKLPIIVGGTGLYLRALLEGLPNLAIPVDQKLRKELEKLSLQELQKKLQRLSLKKWKDMNNSDKQNSRRLVRAIEIASADFTSDGVPKGLLRGSSKILKIGLTAPKETLYKKINSRVEKWIEEGIIDEVKNLITDGISKERIRNLGLEYKVIIDYLNGEFSLDLAIKKMQNKVRQYARRQITWFRKEKDVSWFDITVAGWVRRVETQVNSWYYARDDQAH